MVGSREWWESRMGGGEGCMQSRAIRNTPH